MAETSVSHQPGKRRRWLRLIGWLAAILAVVLVGMYFIATSSAFLKGVILPRVSAALHTEVTVSDAAIHPFRQVILRDLKVQAKGQPALLEAQEVRLDYSLWDILRGNIHVDDIALVSPTIRRVVNPDGSSNLDPLLRALSTKPRGEKPSPTTKSSEPQIDLQKLTVANATLIQVRRLKGGERDVVEVTNLNVTLSGVKNGESGSLRLNAAVRLENNPPAPAMYGILTAALHGQFTFALTPRLQPASIKGGLGLDVSRAEGSLNSFAAAGASLECDLSSTNLGQLALSFHKGSASLGELLATGPLDLAKSEGRVKIELLGVDKRLLNLLGAKSGLDFGTTALSSTNEIQLAKAGSLISLNGRFDANNVRLTRAGESTPVLNFHAGYGVTVDRADNNAILRTLALSGTEDRRPLLQCELAQPMTFSWSNAAVASDSTLALMVTNLNLADWKPVLGNTVPAGEASLAAHLRSRRNGNHLAFDLDAQITNLIARFGSNPMPRATVTFQARGQADHLKQFKLDDYRFQLRREREPVLTVSGSAGYDLADASADGQVTLQASLARLFQTLAQPGLSASAGSLELQGHFAQKQKAQTVSGKLVLTNFTGRVAGSTLRDFGSTMSLELGLTPARVQIKQIAGALTQGGKSGGHFDLTGTYDPATRGAQMTARLVDLNQNALGPFLRPLWADKKVVSVALDGNASVQYEPAGSSSLKADLEVTNLVVTDPQQPSPAAPLAAGLRFDAALDQQTADVRQLELALTPTKRASNRLDLAGHLDFSKTNTVQGNLKLSSDSLDLTRYYDLFAGKAKPTAGKTAASTSETTAVTPTATAGPEPPPIRLPLQKFTASAAIRKLYLHEIEITNLLADIEINGGRVVMKPVQLSLNGAPVTAGADLDLGVPGYRYAATFEAVRVPVGPLADTFAPDRKGQLGGTLSAQAHVSGAGITGAGLKKSLAGTFDISTTNLNLSVVNVRSRLLKSLINVVAAIPQLIHNPEGGLGSLLGGVAGRGGLANDLEQSPIDVITARGKAGGGRIDLQQAVVRSPAFEADAQGQIVLNPVLTNSVILIPVDISLSRPIADRLNLVSADTPTNAAYVPLPNFVTMTRTLGDPKADIKKSAVAGIAVKAIGVNVHGSNLKPGALLKDLGGVLKGDNTNAANSRKPATNQSPAKDLLKSLFK